MSTTHKVFKAYDVRGTVPDEITPELAYQLGLGLVNLLNARTIVVGRDMRLGGPELLASLIQGACDAGAIVSNIGEVSTDALYYAVGKEGHDAGVMVTASHNPSQYNGFKFCGKEASGLSLDSGLAQIRDWIVSGTLPAKASQVGQVIERQSILPEFANHCLSFIDRGKIKPFRIAIDAGNGMAGRIVPHVFHHIPCTVTPMFFQPDGRFPNHPASPIEPENMVALQEMVRSQGCDLGVAFDGDADRMFLVDEKGQLIGGDMVTALVAINTLQRYPGSIILHNLICSRSTSEAIAKHGGVPFRSRVGHSLIKASMREKDIVFGGEHSGHFFFKDNWYADSGMIALLSCLEVFSQTDSPVSEVIAQLDSRSRSGEINSTVGDIPAKLAALKARYGPSADSVDELDGVTIQFPTYWFNVRPSNTEPLLRLNLEADSREEMEERRNEVLSFIRT